MAITQREFEQITTAQIERDAILSGETREWPDPDSNETINLNGQLMPVSMISNIRDGGNLEAELTAQIAAAAKALKVKVPVAGYPAKPLRVSDFEELQRPAVRRLNRAVLQLRAVSLRDNELMAAAEARARGAREQHVMVLREFLDTTPETLKRHAEAVERAKRVGQFLQDVVLLVAAASNHKQSLQVHELIGRVAGALGEKAPHIPLGVMPDNLDVNACKALARLLGASVPTHTMPRSTISRVEKALRALGK